MCISCYLKKGAYQVLTKFQQFSSIIIFLIKILLTFTCSETFLAQAPRSSPLIPTNLHLPISVFSNYHSLSPTHTEANPMRSLKGVWKRIRRCVPKSTGFCRPYGGIKKDGSGAWMESHVQRQLERCGKGWRRWCDGTNVREQPRCCRGDGWASGEGCFIWFLTKPPTPLHTPQTSYTYT